MFSFHVQVIVSICVYGKPAFTGLGNNYGSFILDSIKVNAMKTIFTRGYVSSSWKLFDIEIVFMKIFFPLTIYIMQSYLVRQYQGVLTRKSTLRPLVKIMQDIFIILFPFYGHPFYNIRNKLSNFLQQHYPLTKLNLFSLFHLLLDNIANTKTPYLPTQSLIL